MRTGCTDCANAGVYRRTGGLIGNAGVRISPQLSAGAELVWLPGNLEADETIQTTLVLGVAQFRPWATRGFFVKGGMGLGMVRNWVLDTRTEASVRLRTGALTLGYGAGWIAGLGRGVALQVHATHHAAAVGDITTSQAVIQNVVGNFWMAGAGLVLR